MTTTRTGSGARSGGLAMAVFGLAWWVVAAASLPTPARVAWVLAGVLVTGALLRAVILRLRDEGPADLERHRRGFALLGLTQWAGIVLVVVLCAVAGRQSLIGPLVTLVVAAHFLPLSRMYRWRGYAVLGAALAVVGVVAAAVVLATDPDVVLALTGTGAPVALLLWSASAALVGSAPVPVPAADSR